MADSFDPCGEHKSSILLCKTVSSICSVMIEQLNSHLESVTIFMFSSQLIRY